MTSPSMIIDNRRQLPWQRRLPSEMATAAIWGFWLSLWQPGLRNLESLKLGSMLKTPLILKLIIHGLLLTLLPGAILLVVILVTLLSRQARTRGAVTRTRLGQGHPYTSKLYLKDYAQQFQIAETQVFRGQNSSICRIYHSPSGQITAIVPVVAASQPEVAPKLIETES